jgi:hypothetical protein
VSDIFVTVKRLLTVEEVAERYCTSPRSIHGRTRDASIPHIKRAGFRRVLFDPEQLDHWDLGAQLEVIEPGDGSRVVRTRAEA